MAIKTVHFTNAWHATSGGVATFYRALMDAANHRGHEIRLVVPGENDGAEQVGPFAKIYYLRAPLARLNSQYRIIYPNQFLFDGSAAQQILAEERPDLVEICDKYTLNYLGAVLRRGLLSALDYRPVVVGLSCERMDDNVQAYMRRVPVSRGLSARYMKWLYFPFFDHHIANSEYTAGELHEAARGHAIPRSVWIRPMGVDLRHYSPALKSSDVRRRLRQSVGGNENSILLLYAGRLAPEKHLCLLFDVFLRLLKDTKRDYRLLIAGEGIERPRWEEFCASHSSARACFLGHIKDPSELAGLLANADAFIHPNHREPFGIAPLEAMASGLPLIAPDRGGVASYADSSNAWIAAPDAESFLAAIEARFDDPCEAARRAQNALIKAREFSWENIAAAYLDLYAELHRAAITQDVVLPSPAFSSTPASRLQSAVHHGISQGAEKMFRLASAMLSRSDYHQTDATRS